jgi:hypothetical protein
VRAGLSVTAASVALLAALAGCGSGADKSKNAGSPGSADPDKSVATATVVTVCAKDAAVKTKALPAGFPAGFPLPAGTIVTSAEDRGAGGLVVEGVTPTAFSDVLHSLQTALPAKGFTPTHGETEPHDAESDWSSAEFSGRWAIRELSQCAGDTSVSVVARKK